MGEDSTCFCRGKSSWCQIWSPPPFPRGISDQQKIDLNSFIYKNITRKKIYQQYISECSEWAYPTIKPSTSVSTATAGGTIALIVILVPLVLIALGVVMWYLWKRNKRKTGSISSLPMEKYVNTNYLDNKARANHSWNQSLSQQTTDSTCIGNHYGSLPPENGAAQYVQGSNRTSDEVQPESPREFDKMNKSVLSEEKLAYDNENFDKDGEESPGANSQTPLFDMIDGSGLPNVVPSIERSSLNKINETDQKHKTGEKLPPVDMSIRTSKSSNDGIRSPKKKKPIYLQRKSAPVGGIKDISQDMAGYRKSV